MLTESEVRDFTWNETYSNIIGATKKSFKVRKNKCTSWWWNKKVQEAFAFFWIFKKLLLGK